MYTLFRLLPFKRIALEQVPAFGVAWLIAEFFFKFGSFTLECGAFLAMWFVLDAVVQWVSRRVARPLASAEPAEVQSSESSTGGGRSRLH